MNKRSLLLIIYLTITGCNMDCVEPGLQSRNTSINVDIPVRKDKEAKVYWVDSGQVISKDEEIKFTLGGSVNFCPPKEGKNPRKVLVPAVFCADGSIPNYSKAANINNVPNDYGIDEKDVSRDELCGGRGFGSEEAYSRRRYIDTGIKVDPGDKLSFSLVPREMIIDYDNLTDKDISFDDNCYRTEKGDEKVPVGEILSISEKEGKEFFCDGQDGKRNKVKFLPLDKAKAKKSMVLVGNGYTPYDNKVHFNKGYIENERAWMNGALLDLRQAKIGLDELCDKKNCGFSKVKDYESTKTGLDKLCKEEHCDLNEIRKYSSYELNCYYQNICYTNKGIWNYKLDQAGERNCVSSVRYKKYDNENGKCDMYSHLGKIKSKIEEVKKNAGPIDIVIPNTKDISWAEALVAKISDPGDTSISENEREDMKDTAEGTQCLPEKEKREGESNACSKISDNSKDFSDFSLELNSNYEVKNVASGSSVMLAIADYGYYYRNRGGYHVKVTRSCEYTKGEKLYMYLGDSLPEDKLNTSNSDFKEVSELTSVIEDNIKYYKIDGSHLEKDKSKKIYFGVDVSNVEKEDITDKEGKYYENNKYIVTLFVKRKINDFISSNVEMVFDFIKKEIIGNSIEESYKGYAKGLLKGVRALLTLYIIFTVVGYMLGTLQLSKFDFIVRVMKIASIAFVFSDKSWELFGVTLSKFFVDGSTYLVDSFSGYVGEEGRKFAFLDLTAGVLFTGETWLKFLSLMFAGPFGFIAFLIILHASFMFLKCIISATFRYVISTILVAFLLSLTPLFIVFILFQQTKSLFENWIKTLAHVAIQPVILLSSLSILNQLMYSVLYNLTNFSACYQCLISINFLSYDFCLMKSILPLGYSPGTSVDVALSTGEKAGGYFAALPIDLIQAFIYLIIAGAMEAFLAVSETMAQAIFSSGWGIVNGVKNAADGASQSILSAVGLDGKTQGMISHVKSMMSKDRTELEVKSKQSVGKDKQSSPPDEKKKGALQKKEVLKNIRTRMDDAKDKKED